MIWQGQLTGCGSISLTGRTIITQVTRNFERTGTFWNRLSGLPHAMSVRHGILFHIAYLPNIAEPARRTEPPMPCLQAHTGSETAKIPN
jgi:hypothetical protein